MGYCTTYSLKWQKQSGYKAKPLCSHTIPTGSKFCPECGKPFGEHSLDPLISESLRKSIERDEIYGIDESGETTESVKWYEHEDHIRALSKEFPNVLFTLRGEGEESGDIWNKYFLNGKMQMAKAQIAFDPFDESKLK